MSTSSTAIAIPADSNVKEKTGAGAAAAPAAPAAPAGSKKRAIHRGGWKKGVYVFDFALRLAAIAAALAATITMGTTDETLPFFTQFFRFHASYDDFPPLMFFVIANAIVSGYFVLSLPFSLVTIVRPQAVGLRLLLLVFDTVSLVVPDTRFCNGGPDKRWSRVSSSDRVLGPHREFQSKLAPNLPTVQRLLPEHGWRARCFLPRSTLRHALGRHVGFSPPKALIV
ncbi:hypothetical protein ACLOJK_005905 [Asimina triloba]